MVLITGKQLTEILYLACSGTMILVMLIEIVYSAFFDWSIIVDFNMFKEGVFELLLISWTAFYSFIYIPKYVKRLATEEGEQK